MNEVPDWLWQGLSVWAAGKSLEWAWKNRKGIANRLQWSTPEPVVVNLKPATLRLEAQPISVTATDTLGITDNPTTTLNSSLARRLEELASWYLHVS